ncbi:MAG: GFA family protein [Hyphomicrobiaceae bacterium]|nr:GFA family protein [Hyphomicrobiaceae bacterium]
MTTEFIGGCLCGAVTYKATAAPQLGGHCHCVDCRKSSGTGHCSHLAMNADDVEITGKAIQFDKPADSGNMVSRFFCGTCGGAVYSTNSGMPGFVFLRASSLDNPEVFSPSMIVYTRAAPSWDVMDTSLPSFETMPPEMPI